MSYSKQESLVLKNYDACKAHVKAQLSLELAIGLLAGVAWMLSWSVLFYTLLIFLLFGFFFLIVEMVNFIFVRSAYYKIVRK
jgi:hypothetical protein